jgi:hypothetical protein
MSGPLIDQVIQRIKEASKSYYRLVLIVGLAGSGKTNVIKEVSTLASVPLINLNLELSRQMLDLTERKRILQLPRIVSEIVDKTQGGLVLFDNIELLFDVRLMCDPLRLLQGISRNVTVVSTWNGSITSGHLIYASPGHPEYRRYPIESFLVVSMR